MRHLVACLLVGMMAGHAPADPATPAPSESDQHDEHAEGKLFAFCQLSMLRNRGLTNSFLLGSDLWISNHLLTDAEFCKTLRSVPAPRPEWIAGLDEVAPPVRFDPNADVVAKLQTPGNDAARAKLLQQLGAANKGKLLYIYLHLEGMMALCRPEFAFVFDEGSDTQSTIRCVYITASKEQVSRIFRAHFTLTSENIYLEPVLLVELRKIATEADLTSALLLTETERARFLPVMEASMRFAPVTYGTGIMSDYAP